MSNWTSALKRFAREETAVSSIEYALIASLIAVVCAVAIGLTGDSLALLYVRVCDAFPGAAC